MTIPTTGTEPRRTQVVRIWRQNRCLRSSTIGVYLLWVQRFKAYCRAQELEEAAQLTLAGVDTFATWYAGQRGVDRRLAFAGARSALRAWALALAVLGYGTPPWGPPRLKQDHRRVRCSRNSRSIWPGIGGIRRRRGKRSGHTSWPSSPSCAASTAV